MMTNVPFETVSKQRCFGGTVGFYKHQSTATDCTMKFSVFVPPQAEGMRKVPVL
jgi:S-formylglutathione hydrolase